MSEISWRWKSRNLDLWLRDWLQKWGNYGRWHLPRRFSTERFNSRERINQKEETRNKTRVFAATTRGASPSGIGLICSRERGLPVGTRAKWVSREERRGFAETHSRNDDYPPPWRSAARSDNQREQELAGQYCRPTTGGKGEGGGERNFIALSSKSFFINKNTLCVLYINQFHLALMKRVNFAS